MLEYFHDNRLTLNLGKSGYLVINGKTLDVKPSLELANGILEYKDKTRVIQSGRLVSCIIRGVVSKLITTTLGNRSRIIANGNSPISVIVQSQSYVKLLNLHSLIYTLASSNKKKTRNGGRWKLVKPWSWYKYFGFTFGIQDNDFINM